MLLVAGDFKTGKLSPQQSFYLISISMSHVQPEGKKTLEKLYSAHRDTYKVIPHPPFDKSDHNSILLIPAYKQKLKQEVPVTHSIRKWSDVFTNIFNLSLTMSVTPTSLKQTTIVPVSKKPR